MATLNRYFDDEDRNTIPGIIIILLKKMQNSNRNKSSMNFKIDSNNRLNRSLVTKKLKFTDLFEKKRAISLLAD